VRHPNRSYGRAKRFKKVRSVGRNRREVIAKGEDFTHLEIFERDNWTCGLCDEPIDPLVRQPDERCGTLDHVTPISVCIEEGWAVETIHVRTNVQAAHLGCNLKKGNSRDDDKEEVYD